MRAPVCAWCPAELPVTALLRGGRFCSQKCRQAAFRLRRRRATEEATDRPLRFAYADPPYPGLARRYYASEPTYGGEVDHRALVASLMEGGYAGWALSTSPRALRDVLPLCPPEARVCPWVKPIGVSRDTRGLHNAWEALIVVPGRCERPGFRDWLSAHPARGGGTLKGRKPIAFCAFLFRSLGMRPGDTLDDLFPGTGVVGRAWRLLSEEGASLAAARDVSLLQDGDAFPMEAGDASSEVLSDGEAPCDA